MLPGFILICFKVYPTHLTTQTRQYLIVGIDTLFNPPKRSKEEAKRHQKLQYLGEYFCTDKNQEGLRQALM